jgi:hypothetical protein
MRNCYTYLIGWSNLNKYYYGRRTAVNCDPSELWKSYFTSSVHVTEYRKLHGEPDIVQIRKIFGENFIRCEKWETRVLRKMNLSGDLRFLNRRNNEGFEKCGTNEAPAYSSNGEYIGIVSCDDSRWRVSIFGINKFNANLPENTRKQNLHYLELGTHIFLGENNPSRNKVKLGTHHWLKENNSEQRQAIDDLQRQMVKDGTHHWLSEEHATKTGERTRKSIESGDHPYGIIVTCPNCGRSGQKASMKRWHFDNCELVMTDDQKEERHRKNLQNGRNATEMRMKNK